MAKAERFYDSGENESLRPSSQLRFRSRRSDSRAPASQRAPGRLGFWWAAQSDLEAKLLICEQTLSACHEGSVRDATLAALSKLADAASTLYSAYTLVSAPPLVDQVTPDSPLLEHVLALYAYYDAVATDLGKFSVALRHGYAGHWNVRAALDKNGAPLHVRALATAERSAVYLCELEIQTHDPLGAVRLLRNTASEALVDSGRLLAALDEAFGPEGGSGPRPALRV